MLARELPCVSPATSCACSAVVTPARGLASGRGARHRLLRASSVSVPSSGSAGWSGRRNSICTAPRATLTLPSSSSGGGVMRQSVDPLAAGGSGAMGARQSLDPMAASWADEQWAPGRLLTVKSSAQWEALLREHADKLVVLMCKSHSCRPCKMFTRKYLSVAQRFPECVLAEIYGDETPDTRKMMMQMEVRVTPTFRMYRGPGDAVNVVAGTNDKKLMRGMLAQLTPAELVSHAQEINDTLSIDGNEQQQQQQQQQAAAAAAASEGEQQPSGTGGGSS